MATLIFILSLLEFTFFVLPAVLALICYSLHKKNDYLVVALLFAAYAADVLLIILTENDSVISQSYNAMFVTVPTWKTLIYLVTLSSMTILTAKSIHSEDLTKGFIPLLAAIVIFMSFVPAMELSAYKIWLYYFPAQVYLFALNAYALFYLRSHKDYDPDLMKHLKKILWVCTIFAVLIAIEDTYVIFTQDSYIGEIMINNRNVCEDIMRTIVTAISLNLQIRILKSYTRRPGAEAAAVAAEPVAAVTEPVEAAAKPVDINAESVAAASEDYDREKFEAFCREYRITTREKDILALILKNISTPEISGMLQISVGTTKTHSHNIFQKLGVAKRRDLLDRYEEFHIT